MPHDGTGLAIWVLIGAILTLMRFADESARAGSTGGESDDVKIKPATRPVFAQEPDYSQYPAGISGYTGMDLQQVAFWTKRPAMRARIGRRGLYKTSMAMLPGGELIATACRSADDVPGKFVIQVFRSGDRGTTWAEITPKDARLLGKEPSLTCLTDGTLLLVTQVMGKGAVVYRSTDGGKSWSEVPCKLSMYTRNIIQQPDGSVLLFDADSRLRSTDGGRTWPERRAMTVADAAGFKFEEASILKLDGDRLLAAVRMYGDEYERLTGDLISNLPEFKTMPKREECSDHMVLLESQDAGLHWSKPRSFLRYAEVHAYLTRLKDGTVLATYTNYHVPFSVMAVLSRDNGRTWDTEHPVQLSHSLDMYHGWPTSLQLPDGTVLTCYATKAYLEGQDDQAAEVVRWTLPGDPTTVKPATAPVFAEPPDFAKYPAGISGFTFNLQEVAYWTLKPAMRARVGERGHYKGSLVRLADGSLLANPSWDNKRLNHIYRSTDEGRTWNRIETKGEPLIGGGESRLIRLDDGSILLSAARGVFRSTDHGITWTRADCDKGGGGYGNNIVALTNGDLLIFASKGDWYYRGRKNKPAPSVAWRLRSTDGGRTWTERVKVRSWDNPHPMFDENFTLALSDTHFLCTVRVGGDLVLGDEVPPRGLPTPEGDEVGDRMLFFESNDAGLSWGPPRSPLSYGVVHGHLLRLKDGRLLFSYVTYHLPFSIFAVLSDDRGRTWDTDHPIQLSYSLDMYTGWPTSIQMPDGTIITSYAATTYKEKPPKGTTAAQGMNRSFEVVRWPLPPRSPRRPPS